MSKRSGHATRQEDEVLALVADGRPIYLSADGPHVLCDDRRWRKFPRRLIDRLTAEGRLYYTPNCYWTITPAGGAEAAAQPSEKDL